MLTKKYILLFLMVFMLTSHAQETWKVASLNWQPYADSKMGNQGSSIQKLRELLAKEDISLIVEFFPWNRAKKLAETNSFTSN